MLQVHVACCCCYSCLWPKCNIYLLIAVIVQHYHTLRFRSICIMDSNKKLKTLMQASAAAADTATQHILLSVTADGKVFSAGTDNMVTAILGDTELYKKIKPCMKNNPTTENVGYANTHQLAYKPLPCSPSSPAWEAMGNNVIRGILRNMLSTAGYGRGGH